MSQQNSLLTSMKVPIRFAKMSGAGNDFIVIDNMNLSLASDNAKVAAALCSRHFGIGADGLLILEPSTRADFFMRYYNSDGSYGGMCGNGGRCIARFAFLSGITGSELSFEALDFIYRAEVFKKSVKLSMKDSKWLQADVLASTTQGNFEGYFVDTGSPHFIALVENIADLDVSTIGREIRFLDRFQPEGCNVNFVQVSGPNEVLIRTYERGVEAETLACGTGSVAAALVLAESRSAESPVSLRVRSGEHVKVHFSQQNGMFQNIILEGSAHLLFTGSVLYDTVENSLIEPLNLAHTLSLS